MLGCVRPRHLAAWLLLSLLSCCPSGGSADTEQAENASSKQFFSFKVGFKETRDTAKPSSRRGLLRNATLPLHGAVKDYGYFYAAMYLGSPPKKFAVIVDTGSTMTYVPCASCGSGCGPNHQSPAFDPDASATATKIGCSSPKCVCGSPRCSCANGQCTYTRSYAEQSSSTGVLVEDLLSLHDSDPGAPIIFGCETHETGEIYKQRADGLFGLGNSDVSVINQLVNSGVIDNVFSLCFGAVEGEGAMLLGDAPLPPSLALQHTPLISSLAHPFYYNVKLAGLEVAGARLALDAGLFQHGYGTVLDSGTTFTYLPTLAFQAFAAAVERHALGKGLFKVPGPDPSYEDICFGGAPYHNDEAGLGAVFPSMGLLFDQMEALTLSPLNYLFVHTFSSGKYCLGVFDNGGAGTLLGGITFRNVLVRYDRAARRVGFGHASCRELGQGQRPPCSVLEQEGIAAGEAAASGDCQPVPPRAQQQEQYPPQEGDEAPGAGGEPYDSAEGGGGVPGQGSGTAAPAAGSQGGSGSDSGEGEGGWRSHRTTAVVVGVLVAAAVVTTLVAAALLLRPANRERVRGALLRLRYRPLSDEAVHDPEAGPILGGEGSSGHAGGGGGAGPAGTGVGAGLVGAPATPKVQKLVPLVEMGTPSGDKRMGLTTPTKLQRQGSLAAAAAAAAAAAGSAAASAAAGEEEAPGSARSALLQSPPSAGSLSGLGSPSRSSSSLGRGAGGYLG